MSELVCVCLCILLLKTTSTSFHHPAWTFLSPTRRRTHTLFTSSPALVQRLNSPTHSLTHCWPPSPPPRGERVGVSEGEAATETGSGGQLVRTGVQTACSRQTDLCTWLPTRDWWVKPLSSPPLSLFVSPHLMSVSLSSPTSPGFVLLCLCQHLGVFCERLHRSLHPLLPSGPSFVLVGRYRHGAQTHTPTRPCMTRQTALGVGGWWESNYAWRNPPSKHTDRQVVWGKSWSFFLSTKAKYITASTL